ncbi:class III signal peptide-containing protein [Methanobrevibacter sp.]|uniref:class III signal peptide-containing protein n=1 Tax=Methanobrevibacter sp. TaxID=66852 RepID=UPI0026DF5DBC|nr:class III signal peptide-containing protein [Methanobrevibacter sp.]MDO5861016.1 class III signal peptide-containing protein [Methanobrevibacter sp.]
MNGDNRGQISLEYMLIFTISLIVLIVFTMPLVNQGIKTTLDVSDSIKAKSDLSKIALAIKTVYGEGQGSRQTVTINSEQSNKVDVESSYLSCNLKLKDNSYKLIKVSSKSNLKSSSIYLKKGENNVVVEWPVGSEKMLVYI